MKILSKITKIITLSFIIILLTGCNSNYQSLNNLGIVSSLLIDKIDDKYKAYIEVTIKSVTQEEDGYKVHFERE